MHRPHTVLNITGTDIGNVNIKHYDLRLVVPVDLACR